MKFTNHALSALALGLLAGACADIDDTDAAEDTEEIDDDDTSTVEQGVYTSWYNLSGPAGSGLVRACKTPTRINWEFGYNTYTTAITGGSGISTITSSIAGQGWGQKYRTRGSATTFDVALGKNGSFKGIVYVVAQLPDCEGPVARFCVWLA
jgi:hypothetical protein